MTDYYGPERNTERRICGRIRARVRKNPCAHCLNRDMTSGPGFETCQLFGRRFPLCGTDGRALEFTLDESTIGGSECL